MENATKALMMAASVLMTLIVISVLYFMFMRISETEQVGIDLDKSNKVIEYSNRFEQYNRDLYGSEFLSLVNLQEDYRSRQVDIKGYVDVNIRVTINTAIIENGKTYLQAGTHNVSRISEGIIDGLQKDIEYYEKDRAYKDKNGKWRTVKEYSQLGNRKIAELMDEPFHSDDMDYDIGEQLAAKGGKIGNLMKDITCYKNIQAAYVQFKTTEFRCTNVEYDQDGIVSRMTFIEK